MTKEKLEYYLEKIRAEDLMDTAWHIEQHDIAQRAEIVRLREALKNIYALVMGECPALLNEDSGGDAALCLEIENILKETP